MRIKEYITIDRARDIVWEHLHDPKFMRKWNPRIENIQPLQDTLPGLAYKFKVTYSIIGKTEEYLGEVISYKKDLQLKILYSKSSSKKDKYIIESFELHETRKGTRVCHCLDLKKSGINFFVQLFYFIIHLPKCLFGKRYLSSLKTAVER